MAMSADAFRTWGWRIPFLFSTVLLLLGLYIRLRMNETPVFAKELRLRGASRFPVLDAIASQPRDMPLSCMVAVRAFTMLYLVVTYVLNYGASELRLGYTTVTLVSVASGIIMLLGVLVTSRLSDRIGRRATLIGANGLATLWAVLLFPVLHAGTFAAYAVAVVVTMFIAGFIFGPIGSYMSELFDTRYRYTAVGLCYNASGILGGAVPPLIAGPIISAYGTIVFGTVLAIMCFFCLCCCIALPETKHRALDVNMETK
ncbi:putative MFS family arabinose efflux permease [Paraburkholderia sp. WC7.3g]|uniref:MFS transporter n=1 Tax=Paraburkholderia sp. WC7.3g TaxID=2991070 RepID=UPI003D1EF180